MSVRFLWFLSVLISLCFYSPIIKAAPLTEFSLVKDITTEPLNEYGFIRSKIISTSEQNIFIARSREESQHSIWEIWQVDPVSKASQKLNFDLPKSYFEDYVDFKVSADKYLHVYASNQQQLHTFDIASLSKISHSFTQLSPNASYQASGYQDFDARGRKQYRNTGAAFLTSKFRFHYDDFEFAYTTHLYRAKGSEIERFELSNPISDKPLNSPENLHNYATGINFFTNAIGYIDKVNNRYSLLHNNDQEFTHFSLPNRNFVHQRSANTLIICNTATGECDLLDTELKTRTTIGEMAFSFDYVTAEHSDGLYIFYRNKLGELRIKRYADGTIETKEIIAPEFAPRILLSPIMHYSSNGKYVFWPVHPFNQATKLMSFDIEQGKVQQLPVGYTDSGRIKSIESVGSRTIVVINERIDSEDTDTLWQTDGTPENSSALIASSELVPRSTATLIERTAERLIYSTNFVRYGEELFSVSADKSFTLIDINPIARHGSFVGEYRQTADALYITAFDGQGIKLYQLGADNELTLLADSWLKNANTNFQSAITYYNKKQSQPTLKEFLTVQTPNTLIASDGSETGTYTHQANYTYRLFSVKTANNYVYYPQIDEQGNTSINAYQLSNNTLTKSVVDFAANLEVRNFYINANHQFAPTNKVFFQTISEDLVSTIWQIQATSAVQIHQQQLGYKEQFPFAQYANSVIYEPNSDSLLLIVEANKLDSVPENQGYYLAKLENGKAEPIAGSYTEDYIGFFRNAEQLYFTYQGAEQKHIYRFTQNTLQQVKLDELSPDSSLYAIGDGLLIQSVNFDEQNQRHCNNRVFALSAEDGAATQTFTNNTCIGYSNNLLLDKKVRFGLTSKEDKLVLSAVSPQGIAINEIEAERPDNWLVYALQNGYLLETTKSNWDYETQRFTRTHSFSTLNNDLELVAQQVVTHNNYATPLGKIMRHGNGYVFFGHVNDTQKSLLWIDPNTLSIEALVEDLEQQYQQLQVSGVGLLGTIDAGVLVKAYREDIGQELFKFDTFCLPIVDVHSQANTQSLTQIESGHYQLPTSASGEVEIPLQVKSLPLLNIENFALNHNLPTTPSVSLEGSTAVLKFQVPAAPQSTAHDLTLEYQGQCGKKSLKFSTSPPPPKPPITTSKSGGSIGLLLGLLLLLGVRLRANSV